MGFDLSCNKGSKDFFTILEFKFQFLFGIAADCCDGSDEYDGSIHCPNTCIIGGNIEYRSDDYNSKVTDLVSSGAKKTKNGVKSEESVYNLTGNFLSQKGFTYILIL